MDDKRHSWYDVQGTAQILPHGSAAGAHAMCSLVDKAGVVEDVAADEVVARARQAQHPVAGVAEDVAVHQAVVAVACHQTSVAEIMISTQFIKHVEHGLTILQSAHGGGCTHIGSQERTPHCPDSNSDIPGLGLSTGMCVRRADTVLSQIGPAALRLQVHHHHGEAVMTGHQADTGCADH